jgi:hypothetical protein
LDDPCRSAFGKKVHLQIEMIPAIGNYPHAVLLHQDERRDQHRLQRGDRGQQLVGKGIEGRYLWNFPGIRNNPAGGHRDLKHNEGDRADEAANRICNRFCVRPRL